MGYPLKISFTASTYFHRFFLKNNILEFNPYHISVACIFLAAKTEKGKIAQLKEFLHQFMSKVNEKDQEMYCDIILPAELPKSSIYQESQGLSHHDELSYFKALEIEVCRALNFEFHVHNPLSNIHFLKNALIDYFNEAGERTFNIDGVD